MRSGSIITLAAAGAGAFALWKFWPSISASLPDVLPSGPAPSGGTPPGGSSSPGGAPPAGGTPPAGGVPPAGGSTPSDPEATFKRAATDKAFAATFAGPSFNVDQWSYYFQRAGKPAPNIPCFPSNRGLLMTAKQWHEFLEVGSQACLAAPTGGSTPPAGAPMKALITESDFADAATSDAAAGVVDQSTKLNADQWNYYYALRTGAPLSIVQFPGGNRATLLSAAEWRAFVKPLEGGLSGAWASDPVSGGYLYRQYAGLLP